MSIVDKIIRITCTVGLRDYIVAYYEDGIGIADLLKDLRVTSAQTAAVYLLVKEQMKG